MGREQHGVHHLGGAVLVVGEQQGASEVELREVEGLAAVRARGDLRSEAEQLLDRGFECGEVGLGVAVDRDVGLVGGGESLLVRTPIGCGPAGVRFGRDCEGAEGRECAREDEGRHGRTITGSLHARGNRPYSACGLRAGSLRVPRAAFLISAIPARHHDWAVRGPPRASSRRRQKRTLVRQVGPYQLLRKIGSGGMAEVWSARIVGTHPGEDRFFAIKLLASHLAERAEYRDMFLAEARLSMMLSHANIVRVYDATAAEQDCYMVMELISGMTLSQFSRALQRENVALPMPVSAFIVGELLRALSYAHSVQTEAGSVIVHRDVSPQNVMVTSSGEVKLMDFGIARFASEETQGAFVKGKLQYMPPEQLRKQTRKPTVDLYAVGAILHELLDGRRFRGKADQAKLVQMVMHGEVPPLRHEIPPQIDAVRRGLLEADEDKRIQTGRKALGMLARWPEYREANGDLRELVVRYVEPNSVFEVPEGSKVSSVPEGSFSGVPMYSSSSGEYPPSNSDPMFDPAAAASYSTQPSASDLTAEDDPVSISEVVPVPAQSQRRRRRRGWPFAVAGVVVAAGLGGLFIMLQAGKKEPATETAPESTEPSAKVAALDKEEVKPAEPPPVEPPPEPVPEPVPELAATETGDELELGETGEELEAIDPDAADRVTVPVEFVANEFFFVYVRVGGKMLTLEPRARINLPEGGHSVYLRSSKDEKWQKAGRIVIEADKQYRVEMKKPAGLKLVTK